MLWGTVCLFHERSQVLTQCMMMLKSLFFFFPPISNFFWQNIVVLPFQVQSASFFFFFFLLPPDHVTDVVTTDGFTQGDLSAWVLTTLLYLLDPAAPCILRYNE